VRGLLREKRSRAELATSRSRERGPLRASCAARPFPRLGNHVRVRPNPAVTPTRHRGRKAGGCAASLRSLPTRPVHDEVRVAVARKALLGNAARDAARSRASCRAFRNEGTLFGAARSTALAARRRRHPAHPDRGRTRYRVR